MKRQVDKLIVMVTTQPRWETSIAFPSYGRGSFWTVRKIYPNGVHIVLENDAGNPKRFRSHLAAHKAAVALNDEEAKA